MALPGRLDGDDRWEIHDLYLRYGRAFDAGEACAWAATFAPDGIFHREGADDLVGREQLERFAAGMAGSDLCHQFTNLAAESSPGGARGSADVLVLRLEARRIRLRTLGSYRDELVRLPEGWRFARRTFRPWIAAAVLAGEPMLLELGR